MSVWGDFYDGGRSSTQVRVSLSGQSWDMRSNIKNKVKGSARELKGTIKEKTGRATNNRSMEARGKMERAGGKVQRKVGQAQDLLEDDTD